MIRIITADCRAALRTLAPKSVHCCVTSPPYWGLRDYGTAGQIGLEPTPDEFVAEMVAVFREVRRVLKDTGTVWLNLGDSYAGSGRGGNVSANTSTLEGSQTSQLASKIKRTRGSREIGSSARDAAVTNVARRNTRNLPTRFASDTADHTAYAAPPAGLKQKDLMGLPWMVAFALRADGWYLRQDIIWHKPNPMPESVTDRCTKAHEYIFLLSKSSKYHYDASAIAEAASPNTHARVSQDVASQNGCARANGGTRVDRPMKAVGTGVGFGHGSDKAARGRGRISARKQGEHCSGIKNNESFTRATSMSVVTKRNKRSVWTVNTQGFKEAHFATFPPALIEPCILAGCPKGGIVLDPFFGAGTTGLVSDRLQRDCIGIEINQEYAEMAARRISASHPMLTTVELEKVPA